MRWRSELLEEFEQKTRSLDFLCYNPKRSPKRLHLIYIKKYRIYIMKKTLLAAAVVSALVASTLEFYSYRLKAIYYNKLFVFSCCNIFSKKKYFYYFLEAFIASLMSLAGISSQSNRIGKILCKTSVISVLVKLPV